MTRKKWLTKRRVIDAVVIIALIALLEVARQFLPTDGWGHTARLAIGWLMRILTGLWILGLVVLSVSEFCKGLNEEKVTK